MRMNLTLTESATQKIQQHLKNNPDSFGIRVGVKSTGCSGLAYVLEYVHELSSNDTVIKHADFSIYVDPNSTSYLDGMTIDYQKQTLNEGFEFVNPNEKARCGCGESFTV